MSEIKQNEQSNSETERGKKKNRAWIWIVIILIIAAVIFVTLNLPTINGTSSADATETSELNFAEVVVTDLIQEQDFNGTLGTIEADSIKTQIGGTITRIPLPGEIINQGESLFAIDNKPAILLYGDLPAYRDISISENVIAVSSQLTGTITWIAETGSVIEQGEVLYKVNDHPVIVLYGNEPVYRTLEYVPGWTASEASITAAQASVTIALQNLQNAEAALQPYINHPDDNLTKAYLSTAWAEAKNEYDYAVLHLSSLNAPSDYAILTGDDVLQLQEALISLGYDPNGYVDADGVFDYSTWQMVRRWQDDIGTLEDNGEVDVDLGEIVFLPGPAQVVNVQSTPGNGSGGVVMNVSSGAPASGTDVNQLEVALAELGFDAEGTLIADGIYTFETYQAILEFQAAVGLEQDGIINLGEVIFLPGSVLITNQMSTLGSGVGQWSPILGISLSEKVVKLDLPANEQELLTVGDAVIIELPDNSEVPATVASVSETAKVSSYTGQVYFETVITLDDPADAEGLDEAPVDVIVISNSVEDVMAVPVSALVALLEGGYAVEMDTDNGSPQYIGVEVGFFGSNNLIQIISDQIQPGDMVLVP